MGVDGDTMLVDTRFDTPNVTPPVTEMKLAG